MKITKIALASLALAGICSLAASAKNEAKTAYIFGFASSFNDSTVYFTPVQQLDSAYFTGKKNFLVSRDNYSYQLRDYLEQAGEGYKTCMVMYDLDQKKAEKKWNKLYLKYTQKPKAKKAKNGQQVDAAPTPYQVKTISNGDFSFKAIESTEDTEEAKKAPKPKKQGKGPRPEGPQGGGPQGGAPGGGGMPPMGPR